MLLPQLFSTHPDSLESIIAYLEGLNPFWVYVFVFGIAFIENLIPPSPSDVLVVFAGSLIWGGNINFPSVLIAATLGSTLGFVTMYKIGDWFGAKILDQGKIPFFPPAAVRKVESWFNRYGYWLIVVYRFLAGTRAVVSFFAGMSRLHLGTTTALSCVSALAWNAGLVTAGYYLGTQWNTIGLYLGTYSKVITVLLVLTGIVYAGRLLYRRKRMQKEA